MGRRRAEFVGFLARIVGVIVLVLALPALAADERPLRGVALVIGNGGYENLAVLANPASDARSIEDLLDELGFETTSVRDADSRRLVRAIDRFIEDAEGADAALVYFSGHGIEAGGENWLVPVDADPAALSRAGESLYPLSRLMDRLGRAVPLAIVLLDACRDSPFPPGARLATATGASPAPVSAAGLGDTRSVVGFGNANAASSLDGFGTLIGFAAAPGQVALDGEPGDHSPYAAAVLRHLTAMAGEEFGTVMRMVAEEVWLKTGGRQRPWVNESLSRLLYFGASPADIPGEEGDILAERRRLLLTIANLPDARRSAVQRASAGGAMSLDAVYGMLRALGAEAPADPAELEAVLRDQVASIRALREERAALTDDDPELRRLVDLADRATSEGALQAAVRLHGQAKARVRALDAAVGRAEADIRTRRLQFASVHARSAEAYLSTFDHERAAADFAEAFRQVERWDDRLAWRYKNEEALALAEFGNRRGGARALFAAISAGDVAVETARRLPDPDHWITSLTGLGNAMVTLARVDGDTRWLGEAGALYDTALGHVSREREPLRWAWLQSSIAGIHLTLGERDIGTGELKRAVAAYRAAVDATPRERNPYDWALFQNNLGNALLRLGGRETGGATLLSAIAAYRAALEEFDPLTRPAKHLLTLNNLGKALHELGEREAGVARLEEAVSIQRAVLHAQDRRLAPLEWASTQNDLGNVLVTLGMRTRDLATFEEALAAFRQAAGEWRRDVVPVQWGMAMISLGNANLFLGRTRGDPAPIREAIASYRRALGVRPRAAGPAEWAVVQHNLATALASLGDLENGTASHREAVAAYRALLEVRTREADAREWAGTQHNLGMALRAIGEREKSASALREAAEAFRLALGESPRALVPHAWTSAQAELGEALFLLSELTRSERDLVGAAEALRAALSGYDESRGAAQRVRAHEYLARATFDLGTRRNDVALLAESVAAWRATLALRRPGEGKALAWPRAMGSLGLSLIALGKRTGAASAIAEGRDALATARRDYARAGDRGYETWFSGRLAEADALLAVLPP